MKKNLKNVKVSNKRAALIIGILILVGIFTNMGCSNNNLIQLSQEEMEKPASGASDIENTKGENVLKVHYIDVGQGDSIFIQSNDQGMLIDAGNNGDGKLVVDYIKKLGVKKLNYVVGTHPHEDHIGGLDDVIYAFEVDKIIMPNVTHTTRTFKDVLKAVKNKGMKITTPKVNEENLLGNATFKILSPGKEHYEDLNDYSVTIKLEYGENDFLFMGDAEREVENEILKKVDDIRADVLKLGHHGSVTSTTNKFLEKVQPKYGIISCEKGNRYGHPHSEILKKLKNKKIKIYRTDKDGTIIAISDGKKVWFE